MDRRAEAERKTGETEIRVALDLDGRGSTRVETPVGFFNHMLNTLGCHADVDLEIRARGDVDVDYHHLVEDTGIVLGMALEKALGEKKGIGRFGHALVPMDDALALAALDLSGREHLSFEARFPSAKVGDFDTELVEEFFYGLVRGGRLTLHIKLLSGTNTHHAVESIFKAFARALRQAVKIENSSGEIPSTKGVL